MIWKLTQNKDWQSLEKQFSWVADMKNVIQHKNHHAEGNVAIHTQMVLDELTKMPRYEHYLNRSRKYYGRQLSCTILRNAPLRKTRVMEISRPTDMPAGENTLHGISCSGISLHPLTFVKK